MNGLLILTSIALPFLGGFLCLFLHSLKARFLGLFSSIISLISLFCILLVWRQIPSDGNLLVTYPWVPSLGINLSIIVDGLSLFFGILVTGMGVLVNIYADFYMDSTEMGLGRFYCCLSCFIGSMLAVIFSDNLIVLYIFWEMTGIFSYLLISYYRSDGTAVINARIAFITTFLTGMFLFIGIILIGILDQTYLWSEIITLGINYTDHPFWSYPIMIFFLIGIFGKSVQLPFHFWLPRAMVAPIPVSALLHSATMVKLGIFLTARFYPLFYTSDIWAPSVTLICFGTMLFGAVLSLFSNDLKEILAYATISQLGFFLGFYGMGGEAGVKYDFIHIFNHALYKGSLFMLVGIIHKATGIRDVRYLGGLWNKLPLVTVSFFLAAGSMAGIPGTTGFISKELILGDFFEKDWNLGVILVLLLLISTMIFKVAFSVRIFGHLFLRSKTVEVFKVKKPGLGIQIAPFILSVLAFTFGIWPQGFEMFTGSFFVSSLHLELTQRLKLLHGWEYETFVSLGILVSGFVLFLLAEKSNIWWSNHEIPDWGAWCNQNIDRLTDFSRKITEKVHPHSFAIKLGLLFVGFTLSILLPLYETTLYTGHITVDGLRLTVSLLVVVSAFSCALMRLPMAKLLCLSLTGFFLTLYFVFFLAPDLAITQILVEVISLLILILVFSLKPKEERLHPNLLSSSLKIALSFGVGVAALCAVVICQEFNAASAIKSFVVSTATPLGKGENLVNMILVDYRGLDTMGECAVLIIASLAVFYLLFSSRLDSSVKVINSVIIGPMILFIFAVVNIFAVYLLFRGHNYPGGGFIAGLGTGISFILLSMRWQPNELPLTKYFINHKVSAVGLLLILLIGVAPFFVKEYFLTHYIWGLPTPLIFDIGVYCIVVNITVAIYFNFRNRLAGEEV